MARRAPAGSVALRAMLFYMLHTLWSVKWVQK
jgi:hypothetical protein